MDYLLISNVDIKNKKITCVYFKESKPFSGGTFEIKAKSNKNFIQHLLLGAILGEYRFEKKEKLIKFIRAIEKYKSEEKIVKEEEKELKEVLYNFYIMQ